jgi:hypothetical protein
MLRRHLCLVRAWSAAGLLSFLTLPSAFADEPADPLPTASAQATTVKILDARKSGDLGVELRGHGQAQVRMILKNTSAKRLNVVIPPGLVAASAVGQGAGGAGAGGGPGLQSMGLGAPGNKGGGFGNFGSNADNPVGFRSVPVVPEIDRTAVVVPAGQTVELDMPAVCLNYGLPSPNVRDKLTLVDVDDFSRDPRVRKALRSVATIGTSQGTAQAIMWNVCNGLSFQAMLVEGGKVCNRYEVALAARFVEALDGSTSSETVDPALLTEARVFVTVLGDKGLEKDAIRLASEMEGLRVLGLPVRASVARELPRASAPALHVVVSLSESKKGETQGKVSVRYANGLGNDSEWTPLGQTTVKQDVTALALKGVDLARTLDHAVASSFVTAKVGRKQPGSTTLKIDNRLPFSIASVTIKAGDSAGSPPVTFSGLGIGPARSGTATLQAPTGTIERVELNGL